MQFIKMYKSGLRYCERKADIKIKNFFYVRFDVCGATILKCLQPNMLFMIGFSQGVRI